VLARRKKKFFFLSRVAVQSLTPQRGLRLRLKFLCNLRLFSALCVIDGKGWLRRGQ